MWLTFLLDCVAQILFVLFHAALSVFHFTSSIVARFRLVRPVVLGKSTPVPRHLSFVIEDCESETEAVLKGAELAWFAIVGGAKFVTIHDSRGLISSRFIEFSEALSRQAESSPHRPDGGIEVAVEPRLSGSTPRMIIAGAQAGNVVVARVRLSSSSDGRGDIARAIREASERGTEPDQAFISGHLRASDGFPDPEMCVVLGRSRVMSGFQPWQTRLTEFFFEGEANRYSWPQFTRSVSAFSNREKRFGR